MYRHKEYVARPVKDVLAEMDAVRAAVDAGASEPIRRVFLADGDALALPTSDLLEILSALRERFPPLSRVSCYATARNLLEKSVEELSLLGAAGLSLLYIGPESGDDVTLKAIAKGANFADHVEAARRAREAGLKQSLMFLLGIAGEERGPEHARASARLVNEMDPRFVSLLTATVVPATPLFQLAERGKFVVPEPTSLLREIREFLAVASPTNTVFRSNHASNYLPLAGRLPRDRQRLLGEVDAAMRGEIGLRPEWARGL